MNASLLKRLSVQHFMSLQNPVGFIWKQPWLVWYIWEPFFSSFFFQTFASCSSLFLHFHQRTYEIKKCLLVEWSRASATFHYWNAPEHKYTMRSYTYLHSVISKSLWFLWSPWHWMKPTRPPPPSQLMVYLFFKHSIPSMYRSDIKYSTYLEY